jgi:hypothetical protein
VARTPPTVSSLLSNPSTVMLLDRALWPPNDSPDVAAAPCRGIRSLITPGVNSEKDMKFRPLAGSCANLILGDDAGNDGAARVDDRRLGGHRDRAVDGRWMEDDVEVDRAAERQLDGLQHGCGKTGQLDPDAVLAERDGRDHEPAVRACERIALDVRLDIHRRYTRAGHDSSRIVFDDACEVGGGRTALSESRSGPHRRQGRK